MLNGTTNFVHGFPAINVWRLSAGSPIESRPAKEFEADEVILTAIEHPPRIGEIRPISLLVSEVLARYGLSNRGTPDVGNALCGVPCAADDPSSIDLVA